MQQKYLQFHTSKSFSQTLEILEKEKLEIIFQSNECRIDFTELTIEEQISWIEANEEHMKHYDMFFKKQGGNLESYFESIMDFRKQTKELVKLHRNNPSSYKTSEKYDQFIKAWEKVKGKYDFRPVYHYSQEYLKPNVRVSCSCIIAKKGTNLVRYLSFESDPIVTIIGSKASDLKTSLKSKF